jgi:hypothetical protein
MQPDLMDSWPFKTMIIKVIVAQTCVICNQNADHGQSELAFTSAPTWMDGALMGFPFLSMCDPMLTFFFVFF